MSLRVPADATVLQGTPAPALGDPQTAVAEAIANPIGTEPLAELLAKRKPKTVAITISDITRPVPNRDFLPALLETINTAGIDDSHIVIIIGTGMHSPGTEADREALVGRDILDRIEVIDHRADDPSTLLRVCDDPPIRVCARFAKADFRIVTGFIEPHFMAGFSGGRKGVCPALVDLQTVRRFHGFDTMADPNATMGNLRENPCHEIALKIARAVGVDFLFNVAITGDHRVAGVFCGDLEQAHQAGCEQVAKWTSCRIDEPFDLVITSAGGHPLDQNFYQSVKGMCAALPALGEQSTLLQISECSRGVGSRAYTDLMLRYDNDWRAFLRDIEANRNETRLDQWEYQMHARVLKRVGREKLGFVSDGIDAEMQKHLSVTPILGEGDVQHRTQRAIDEYLRNNPAVRVAVIPDGPYTLLQLP
ncbi:MAG: nickel-dependent lactate racemase [Phycisphaerae bacterium]|nr:nickel-dependent lactate racemase [Phycisphaerae bacterium]